jgi:acetoin utilization deacetylase AcuC-like enzyme
MSAYGRREMLQLLGVALAGAALPGAGTRSTPARPERADALPVYYSADYVRSEHAFETTRKARWVAESLVRRPLAGVRLLAPRALTEAEVSAVHDPRYVTAVRTGVPRALAQSQGFSWDPGLWPMVLASNGGAVEAARTALRTGLAGSLSSGLHHARRDTGRGFCTFNGLVLAARAAQAAGARRILILDLDAHCGGGTSSLLGSMSGVVQLDIAVNAFDHYVPSAPHTLDLVSEARDYLPTLTRRLRELSGRFDLCLYNAGMDPHEGSSTGGLPGIDARLLGERERIVFSWCASQRLPVAFVLAGGYTGPGLTQQGLVELHRLTLAAATRASAAMQQ